MAASRKAEVDAAQKTLDYKKNKYQIVLDTTMGTITLDMLSDVAPGHCNNMLGLAKIGYYDGLGFHRIIKRFMIQGGCPEGTGTGGPGYTIKAEFNPTKHEPGVVSFFICLERVPHLDNQYTAFGRTADAESLSVVKAIGEVATDANDRPKKPVRIKTVEVVETPK
jgi:peptidyl-prolyl cis-trans isomerase B (cyclophilin B)